MEFGPRALGNRSILASPLDPYSTENLNIFIKHREPFRKFAASVPAELASEYFDAGPNARYLATVGRVRPSIARPSKPRCWATMSCASTLVSQEDNPLYPSPAARSWQSHRPAGSLQHQLQFVRRPAGLHAARCRAQLLFLGHRRAVRGKFRSRKVALSFRKASLLYRSPARPPAPSPAQTSNQAAAGSRRTDSAARPRHRLAERAARESGRRTASHPAST